MISDHAASFFKTTMDTLELMKGPKMNTITRDKAMQNVGYCVDDALTQRSFSEMPDPSDKVRLIGFQAGAEVMFVAVWSYLGHRLDDDDAVELATDLLLEKEWFADGQKTDPAYVL